MNRYEGLLILNVAGKEDQIPAMLDSVSERITSAGGEVEGVEKMDKKQFSRVVDKNMTAGYFTNVTFSFDPSQINELATRLRAQDEVHRLMLTLA